MINQFAYLIGVDEESLLAGFPSQGYFSSRARISYAPSVVEQTTPGQMAFDYEDNLYVY